MAEDKELKPKSMRLDDATFKRFQAISAENFGSQGQCLEALLALYDLETSKQLIPERTVEIESFQAHLNSIGDMFVSALKLNQDAELRVRSKFEALMVSKDQTITELQSKVAIYTEELKSVKESQQVTMTELVDEKKRVKDLKASIETKEKLIAALEEKNAQSAGVIADMAAEKTACAEKLRHQSDIEKKNDTLQQELVKLTAQFETDRSMAALELERKLLDKDREHQEALAKLREDQYNQLQAQVAKMEALRDELDGLRKENAALNKQLSDPSAVGTESCNEIDGLDEQ